jgi:hypothetical protein
MYPADIFDWPEFTRHVSEWIGLIYELVLRDACPAKGAGPGDYFVNNPRKVEDVALLCMPGYTGDIMK